LADTEKRAPKTAIVILNWNSGEMTGECIRSLLSMKAQHYDIIVVDNGSKDGSVDYLRKQFPLITVLAQNRNLGFAAGCNVGMKLALERGAEYVLPLNNDTVVDPSFLAELLTAAETLSRAAIVSPKIYFWDWPDKLWWAGGRFNLWSGIPRHRGRKQVDTGQFDVVREIDWATGCAALIRCDVLHRVGLFDETFFGNVEDLDLSLRVRQAGYRIYYAPKAKLWHKEGADYRKNAGEYLRKFTGTRNLLLVMRKHASVVQWMTFLPNFLSRYVAFYIALSLIRGDFRSAWAVVKGIGASVSTKVQSDAGRRDRRLAGANRYDARVYADKDALR
jgi:GT2 family glycosyltransferase